MLQELIDTAIQVNYDVLQVNSQREWDTTKFRVSNAGRCRLYRYWKRLGKEGRHYDVGTLRRFTRGNVWHSQVQGMLRDQGVLIVAEFEMEDKHRIGHLDAIVKDPETGKRVLYDLKFSGSKKFWHVTKNGAVDLQYHYQITTYFWMLPVEVAEVRIAYFDENLTVYEVPVNVEKLQVEVQEDWNILINAWEQRQEPESNPMDWECKYCVYNEVCVSE